VHDALAPTEPEHDVATLPPGAGLALIGAALMVAGAIGPWIGGRFLGGTAGIDLGGDGWLVVGSALLGILALLLPSTSARFRGVWMLVFAFGGAFVCWTHYNEAHADGLEVVWGLELAGIGSALLAVAGLRLLLSRS
jgi:hypothetical protein